MRQEQQPQGSRFKDFVRDRAEDVQNQFRNIIPSNRLNPAMAGASPDLAKPKVEDDSKTKNIQRIVKTRPDVLIPETRSIPLTPDEAKKQKKRGNKLAKTVKVALAGGIVAGGAYGVYQIPAIHQGVDQLGDAAKHWSGVGKAVEEIQKQSQKIQDNAEQFVTNRNKQSGAYDISPVPGRSPESLSSIPTSLSIEDIPAIPENDPLLTSNITLGALFIEAHKRIVVKTSEILPAPPALILTGYFVGKETQPDGSTMFAIALPRLSSPKDILKGNDGESVAEVKNITTSSGNPPKEIERTVVGGRIVWIKLFEGEVPDDYPFKTSVAWGKRDFQSIYPGGNNKAGVGNKPLVEYLRKDDLIRARVELDVDTNSDRIRANLASITRRNPDGETVDQAAERLKQTIVSNAQNANRLEKDAGNPISLDYQLRNKAYVFTPEAVAFLPK